MRRSVRRDDAAGLAVLQPHREAARTCTSYHILLLQVCAAHIEQVQHGHGKGDVQL
jgi:hypothetical protein